jgi:hypothetical protein
MIELLAQAVETSVPVPATGNTLFGLSVGEWLLLMGAVPAFIGAIYERLGRKRGESKLRAIIEAVEETKNTHPEVVKVVKRAVLYKATQMGVQTGIFGLEDDVKKLTKHFDAKKLTKHFDLDGKKKE